MGIEYSVLTPLVLKNNFERVSAFNIEHSLVMKTRINPLITSAHTVTSYLPIRRLKSK